MENLKIESLQIPSVADSQGADSDDSELRTLEQELLNMRDYRMDSGTLMQ